MAVELICICCIYRRFKSSLAKTVSHSLGVAGWMFSVQVFAETIAAVQLAQNNHSSLTSAGCTIDCIAAA